MLLPSVRRLIFLLPLFCAVHSLKTNIKMKVIRELIVIQVMDGFNSSGYENIV